MSLFGGDSDSMDGMTSTASTWDVRPLTEALTPDQVRQWRRTHREVKSGDPTSMWALLVVAPILIVGVLVASSTWTTALQGGTASRPVFGLLVPLGMLVVAGVIVVATIRSTLGRNERLMRLYRFAEANGFIFSPRQSDPDYPGMVFGIGRRRTTIDHIVRGAGRFLDIGNFRYTTGSGKNQKTRTWGFMALHLDRRLPHMLLDARSNNVLGMSNLPAMFSRDQVLSLEGDFDRHFTLSCPREYERDALYVFTPDLMALLIDEAGAFDVEVIDDWMFVYSTAPFRMGDPSTMLRLLRIIDTVGAKTVTQTDRYADERIGDPAVNLVAPKGARLRRGVPWATILIGAVFVAVWLVITFVR